MYCGGGRGSVEVPEGERARARGKVARRGEQYPAVDVEEEGARVEAARVQLVREEGRDASS